MLTNGEHIQLWEVACHDGTPFPEALEAEWNIDKTMFDKIRNKYGRRIHVVCGYRSIKWNKKLIREDKKRGAHGVASGSAHVLGKALDIRCDDPKDNPQLYRLIMSMYENGELDELGGIAIYPFSGWIHIDTVKAIDGHLRKWKGT